MFKCRNFAACDIPAHGS